MKLLTLNLIAAVCRNMGIGYKGSIPWNLKNEIAYFGKITTSTSKPGVNNIVIMGRKTWLSIPPQSRPLKNRINIVLSQTEKKIAGAHHTAKSVDAAIYLIKENEIVHEHIFIIGGERVYKEAIESNHCQKFYLTRIDGDFDCDTFFPAFNSDCYELVDEPGVDSRVQLENGLRYKYEVYVKKG